jgi:tetratricopeptide (TPR) repeat protein
MRGMALKERFLRADMLEARRHFDQAIAPSPQLAPAHGWLAWTWFFEACMGWAEDPAPAVRETFRAAREALRLDPDLDFAHRALGAAWMAAGDMNRSLAAFERALELDPNNSDAMANRAWPPMFAGDPDAAVESVERAARLDPFHPDRHLRGLGMAGFARDAPEASISAPSRMARPNRQSPAFLAAAHHRAGDDAAAAEAAAHPTNLDSGFTIEGVLGPLPFADPTVRDRLNAALKAVGPP